MWLNHNLFFFFFFCQVLLLHFLWSSQYWCFQNEKNGSHMKRVIVISNNKAIMGIFLKKQPYTLKRTRSRKKTLIFSLMQQQIDQVSRIILIVEKVISCQQKIIHNNKRIKESSVLSLCLQHYSPKTWKNRFNFFPFSVSLGKKS